MLVVARELAKNSLVLIYVIYITMVATPSQYSQLESVDYLLNHLKHQFMTNDSGTLALSCERLFITWHKIYYFYTEKTLVCFTSKTWENNRFWRIAWCYVQTPLV